MSNLSVRRQSSQGYERIQLLVVFAIVSALIILLVPALLKKIQTDKELKMKALLRTLHSANQAHAHRNPNEGYANNLETLVNTRERVRYLEKRWLMPTIEGFHIQYQSPEKLPRARFSLLAKRSGVWAKILCIDQRGIIREAAGQLLSGTPQGCEGGIEVV